MRTVDEIIEARKNGYVSLTPQELNLIAEEYQSIFNKQISKGCSRCVANALKEIESWKRKNK